VNISKAGLALIESFEGFSATPYRDSVGVLTIGYGTTQADVDPLPTHLTQPQAEQLLARMVDRKYGAAINELGLPLNQHQFDATCSFTYNLGPGVLEPGYSFGRALRAHEWQAAADAMLAYDHAGGQVLPGLSRRRQEERALFLRPVAVDPLAVLTPDERALVQRFDELRAHHPAWHPHAIAKVRAQLVAARKAIWLAANGRTPGTAPGWDIRQRRARYHLLLERTT
jgi:lysozyme